MNFDGLPPHVHEPPPSLKALRPTFGFNGARIAYDILLRNYQRTRLSEAQNHRCCYCQHEVNDDPNSGRKATIEHVVCRCRGGDKLIWRINQVVSCAKCNHRRGNKELPEIEKMVWEMNDATGSHSDTRGHQSLPERLLGVETGQASLGTT